jgi:hypothetical protein
LKSPRFHCSRRKNRIQRQDMSDNVQNPAETGHEVIRKLPPSARQRAGGLPHARCAEPSALCRQGAGAEKAGVVLCQAHRTQPAHRPDDPGNRVDDVPDDADGNRGAAARTEPDQAAQAEVQRASARRQKLPQHPGQPRAPVSADQETSRREEGEGRVFRSLRERGRGEPDAQPVAEGVPAAQLLRRDLRQPDAALPAVPDQALFRSLRRPYQRRGVRGLRRRCRAVPQGRHDRPSGAARRDRWQRPPRRWSSSAPRRSATVSAP